MTLSANQPYFLPYFPYWQLIAASDIFLIGDDYAFIRHGWIERNWIMVGDRPAFFRLELQHKSSFRLIKDIPLVPYSSKEKLGTVERAYHRAPFFDGGYALLERILSCEDRLLADFLEHSIREVCAYLGIDTRILRTSSLEGNRRFRREERIYDFCHRLGATRYVNAIGGQALYDPEDFRRQGLELRFIQSEAPLPPLSILHHIMYNSPEDLHRMLGQYRLL